MPEMVNIHEAKTHLSRLLERVRQGEEIILSKSGKPVARLMPLKSMSPRIPGIAKGSFDETFFDQLPEEELAAWGQ